VKTIFPTTNHCPATDTRPLEDLTDLELAQAIREGRPGAMTEECLRVYMRKLGITDRRVIEPAHRGGITARQKRLETRAK
jgi:hypothetical protein